METSQLENNRNVIREQLFQAFNGPLDELKRTNPARSKALQTWFGRLAEGTIHDLRIASCLVFECKTGLFTANEYIDRVFRDSEHINPDELSLPDDDTCRPYHQFNNATNWPASKFNFDELPESIRQVNEFYASANATSKHPAGGYVRYINFDAFFECYVKLSKDNTHLNRDRYKLRYSLGKDTLKRNRKIPFPLFGPLSNILMRGQRLMAWIMPIESIQEAEKPGPLTAEQIAQRLAFSVNVDEQVIDKSLLIAIHYPPNFSSTVYQPSSMHPGWPYNGFVPALKDHTCYGATCSCIHPLTIGFPERIHIAFPLYEAGSTNTSFNAYALGYVEQSVDLDFYVALEETLNRFKNLTT